MLGNFDTNRSNKQNRKSAHRYTEQKRKQKRDKLVTYNKRKGGEKTLWKDLNPEERDAFRKQLKRDQLRSLGKLILIVEGLLCVIL